MVRQMWLLLAATLLFIALCQPFLQHKYFLPAATEAQGGVHHILAGAKAQHLAVLQRISVMLHA